MKPAYTSSKQTKGYSIVELMIALTLGLMLMAAMLQFIVGTRQTYDLNNGLSHMQENGRLAMDILTRDLQMAGYQSPRHRYGEKPDFFLIDCQGSSAASACLFDATDGRPDRLAIQYDPPPDDGSDTDCQGNAIPATALITNVYTLDDIDGDGVTSLYCQSMDGRTKAWLSARPMPLVDGIDNLQIQYRVVTPATVNSDATYRYLSGSQLTPKDWPNITGARIALLVSSGLKKGFAEKQVRSFQLLDSPLLTFDDSHIRRIYSTSIQFNNF